jgi:RNA polymerase sigma-70 factor, ECF subfamily
MDDAQVLLQDVRQMNKEALAKVFDFYAPAIYKYAYRLCADAVMADQIVGDVFSKLLEQLSMGSGPNSHIRSYLFEMAYHAIVDEIRHSLRMTSISAVESFLPGTNSADITTEERTMLEIVLRVIQSTLTEDQRHVVILRLLEDFSVKETALIMGKKANNIKVIQNRAIAALRKAIDDQVVIYQSIE